MELKIMPYKAPETITFNFEELKNELEGKVHIYETAVYDDTQIQQAKADRADLNKLKKALNDERIRREKEYMIPFNAFKDQINEIIKIIDKPVGLIDQQIKAYEEKEKTEKKESIISFFDNELREDLTTIPPEWLKLEQIWSDRWLNKSVSMAAIKDEIKTAVTKTLEDLTTLQNLPDFGFEASEVYKSSLDMNRALNEARRMSEIQKAKEATEKARLEKEMQAQAEAEAQAIKPEVIAPEQVPQEAPKTWVKFAAYLTVAQAQKLKAFFDENDIAFKAV